MKMTLAALLLAAGPLAAQSSDLVPMGVAPCDDDRSAVRHIVEPWEASTATFANGDVRIALIDTGEPQNTPYHLLVLSPSVGAASGRTCQVLSWSGNTGWGFIAFESLYAEYDPAKGLFIQFEGFVPPEEVTIPQVISFTLNQSTGQIDGRTRPAY